MRKILIPLLLLLVFLGACVKEEEPEIIVDDSYLLPSELNITEICENDTLKLELNNDNNYQFKQLLSFLLL